MASVMNRTTEFEPPSAACLARSAWPSRMRLVSPGATSGARTAASSWPISLPVSPVSVAPRTSATAWTTEDDHGGISLEDTGGTVASITWDSCDYPG